MKCAIMQPTYLPWSGYFNLATQVDYFVILNDVQFNKRSWQQRNRILNNGSEYLLTVPVFSKGRQYQLINEVEINDESDWRKDHLKTIMTSYNKSVFKSELFSFLEEIYNLKTNSLFEFNMNFIQSIFKLLDIKTKIILSSDLKSSGKKSEYLFNICSELNCTEYLSPMGSKGYLEEEGVFRDSSIQLAYQDYDVKVYQQLNTEEFVSHLSIIDVLLNLGIENTKIYVK